MRRFVYGEGKEKNTEDSDQLADIRQRLQNTASVSIGQAPDCPTPREHPADDAPLSLNGALREVRDERIGGLGTDDRL